MECLRLVLDPIPLGLECLRLVLDPIPLGLECLPLFLELGPFLCKLFHVTGIDETLLVHPAHGLIASELVLLGLILEIDDPQMGFLAAPTD